MLLSLISSCSPSRSDSSLVTDPCVIRGDLVKTKFSYGYADFMQMFSVVSNGKLLKTEERRLKNEPRHEKTRVLPIGKQRRRSASQ